MSGPTFVLRPKLRCRAVRYWCALTDTTASGHARNCGDCRAFLTASEQLDDALGEAAITDTMTVPAGFERSVLRSIRLDASGGANVSNAGTARRPWGLLLAGIAAASLLLLFAPSRKPAGNVLRPSSDDAVFVIQTVESLSTEFVESVLPSTGVLMATNPLQQEVDSIYADARSALGFLAMNFLPPAQQPPRPRSG